MLALVAAAVIVTSPMPLVSGPMLLAQSLGASVAFVNARRKVRPHAAAPATVREAALGPRPGLPGGFIVQSGPFLILFGAAAYLGFHWEDVPARFPTHWNLAGRPDGWTLKSVAGVFQGVSIGVVVCSMTLFTLVRGLALDPSAARHGRDGQQARRVRQANLIAMLASEYLIALLLAWTSVVSMFSITPAIFAFRSRSGSLPSRCHCRHARGSGDAVGGASDGPPIGDTTPDSCWLFAALLQPRGPGPLCREANGIGIHAQSWKSSFLAGMIVAITAIAIPLLMA